MVESATFGLENALEWLGDCARETAVAVEDNKLEERVMDLFRAEDVDGLARLMQKSKLEKEFLDDLSHFIARWVKRTGGEGEA